MPKMTEEEKKAKARERARQWRIDNPDKVKAAKERYRSSEKGKSKEREYGKKYRDDHKDDPGRKEKAREITRLWRLANPEWNQKLQAEYRARPENRELSAQRSRAWAKENSERAQAWRKENYAKNREDRIKSVVQWQRDNPEKSSVIRQNYRARKKANGGKLSPDLVGRLMILQKGRCACCKVKLTKGKRHLDHVISLKAGGPNEDSNCQLLCAPCNCSKRAKDPTEFMQSKGYLL